MHAPVELALEMIRRGMGDGVAQSGLKAFALRRLLEHRRGDGPEPPPAVPPDFVGECFEIGCKPLLVAGELILGRLYYGKWINVASAYITGISVGILLRSEVAFWPYAFCSAVSILSKYVIRVEGRHIWNPSNFGIGVTLIVAGWAVHTVTQELGNSIWPKLVIWTLGSIIIYRLNRFLDQVTRPVLAPFQRFIPLFGGVDISPIIAILVLIGLRGILLPPLELFLVRLVGG